MAVNKNKGCACHECVSACKRNPGWFAPGQAEEAAQHLGIPFEDFKKNLIIDYWVSHDGDDIYVYAPRKINVDRDRKVASFSYAFKDSTCIFLKKDRCSIHIVKPQECRNAVICKGTSGSREAVAMEWKNKGNPLAAEQ